MNKFIEIAISNYIKEHPGSDEREVIVYLQSLGYAIQELEYQDLINSINRAKESKNYKASTRFN